MSFPRIVVLAVISVLVVPLTQLLSAGDSRPGTRTRPGPTTSGKSSDSSQAKAIKEFEGFRFEPPAEWKPKALAHRGMRQAEYVLPGPPSGEGAGELIVYYFGRTSAGSAEANLQRWKGQFTKRSGVSDEEFASTSTQKVAGMQVTILEIHGDYTPMQAGPRQSPPQKNSMMLAAVIETGFGNYYIRTLGPLATLEHWKKAWYKTVLSIKSGTGGEKKPADDGANKESS